MTALLRIEAVDAPDDALRQQLAAPLLAFNSSLAGPSGHLPLVLVLRDAQGGVAGGLWAATAYGWMYTQMLVVPEAARGTGLGTRLMQQAETTALQRGCHHAWVDTQFGAMGFYQRQGYALFAQLPDYPPGFARSFLKKKLVAR